MSPTAILTPVTESVPRPPGALPRPENQPGSPLSSPEPQTALPNPTERDKTSSSSPRPPATTAASTRALELPKIPEPEAIHRARHGDTSAYLRLGSKGAEVAWLKQELNRWIASNPGSALKELQIPQDPSQAVFDAATETAVKAFQRATGTMVDGIVGFRTLRLLDKDFIEFYEGKKSKEQKADDPIAALIEERREKMLTDAQYEALLERDRQRWAELMANTFGSSPEYIGDLGDGVPTDFSNAMLTDLASLKLGVRKLFDGGSNSWMARIIGLAEGTRTRDGGKNQHWGGHSDPGNGKRNVGSFSVQSSVHGISNPEQADRYYANVLLSHLPGFLEAYKTGTGQSFKPHSPQDIMILMTYMDAVVQAPACLSGTYGLKNNLGTVVRNLQGVSDSQRMIDILTQWRSNAFRRDDGALDAPGLGGLDAVLRDQRRRITALADGVTIMVSQLGGALYTPDTLGPDVEERRAKGGQRVSGASLTDDANRYAAMLRQRGVKYDFNAPQTNLTESKTVNCFTFLTGLLEAKAGEAIDNPRDLRQASIASLASPTEYRQKIQEALKGTGTHPALLGVTKVWADRLGGKQVSGINNIQSGDVIQYHFLNDKGEPRGHCGVVSGIVRDPKTNKIKGINLIGAHSGRYGIGSVFVPADELQLVFGTRP